MHRIRKVVAIILSIVTLSSVFVFSSSISAGAKGTGAGLAEWALNAYYSKWSYVWGGSKAGAVDCSGLIYSYCGGARVGSAQLSSATERGSVSSGIPRVHGLGLYMPGHVGVYVGDGMEVDARNEQKGVCYQSVASSYMGWTTWFKLAACNYVENGWEKFNGNYYYYENGQYVVSTSRTIDGITYNFDSTGKSDSKPGSTSSNSSSSSSSNSSSSTTAVDKKQTSKQTSWRKGSTGEEVKKIQTRLKALGYYNGKISGIFGSLTEQAYKEFQKQAGLTVDGIAGSDRKVLYSSSAPKAPVEEPTEPKTEEVTEPATEPTEAVTEETTEPQATTEETTAEETQESEDSGDVYQNGDENEVVSVLQGKLAQLGYFDIEITGFFGDYTTQSVKNFQLANGLYADGIVDEETYKMIFSENAVYNPLKEDVTAQETSTEELSGPLMMPVSTDVDKYIITNKQNQSYADTAVEVIKKTNKVTNRALAKSQSAVVAAKAAQVQRTANLWLWFGLVVVIMGGLGAIFTLRDKKSVKTTSRYTESERK